jgi:hypothetical protein
MSAPGVTAAPRQAGITVSAPRSVPAGGLVSVRGRVRPARAVPVRAQRRAGRRWLTVAAGTTTRRGSFAVTFQAPTRRGVAVVRVVEVRAERAVAASSLRRMRVTRARGAVASDLHAVVLAPSTVESVPTPGRPGRLVYAGGNSVKVGQVIAVDQGPRTPVGFLGRATSVRTKAGETIVGTVPASLLEAVPNGSIDASLATAGRGARAKAAATSRLPCTGSASASFGADVTFDASMRLLADWTFLRGLRSASLTANASASGGLDAAVQGAVRCLLPRTTIAQFDLPSQRYLIGALPIVITSHVTLDLDGSVEAGAGISTNVKTGFSTSATVAGTKAGGFAPVATFDPHFDFTRPTVNGTGDVAGNLTPTIQVLIDGVAGPRIALRSGLDFTARSTIFAFPSWNLSAPVSLTGRMTVPLLRLTSPVLRIYDHTFVLYESMAITPVQLKGAVQGIPYSERVSATGGKPPYFWSGYPPAGLTLNPLTGVISGTPEAVGTFPFDVTVTDTLGLKQTWRYYIAVVPG